MSKGKSACTVQAFKHGKGNLLAFRHREKREGKTFNLAPRPNVSSITLYGRGVGSGFVSAVKVKASDRVSTQGWSRSDAIYFGDTRHDQSK